MRDRPIRQPIKRRPRPSDIVILDDGVESRGRPLAPVDAAREQTATLDEVTRVAAEEDARQLQLALSSVAAAREAADQAQREALQHRRSAGRAWRLCFLITVLFIGAVIAAAVVIAEKEKARGIAEARIGILQRDVDDARTSIDRRDNVKVKLAAAEGRLAEVLANLAAARDKLHALGIEHAAAQERADRLDHMHRTAAADRDQFRSRMVAISQELVDTKKELARLERELAAARARIPVPATAPDAEEPDDSTNYFPWRDEGDGDGDDAPPPPADPTPEPDTGPSGG